MAEEVSAVIRTAAGPWDGSTAIRPDPAEASEPHWDAQLKPARLLKGKRWRSCR